MSTAFLLLVGLALASGSHSSTHAPAPQHRVQAAVGPTITNLGLAESGSPTPFGKLEDTTLGQRWLVLSVSERAQGGTDLNGNGLVNEDVLFVHDLWSGVTTNVGKGILSGIPPILYRGAIGAALPEASEGLDYNGDGDANDAVVHLYDPQSGVLVNTRASLAYGPGHTTQNPLAVYPGGRLVIEVAENAGIAVNDDGDFSDVGIELWHLGASSGLQPAGPLSVRRSAAPVQATGPLGIGSSYSSIGDQLLLVGVDEPDEGGRDLNGDGDALDHDVLFLVDLASGARRNLGIAGNLVTHGEGLVAFRAPESASGQDTNADGDLLDQVLHVYDLSTRTVTCLGLAVGQALVSVDGSLLALVSEADQGATDLNGDGDAGDLVAHHLVRSGPGTAWVASNTGLAALAVAGRSGRAFFTASEAAHGDDLNGDGDGNDFVLHVVDPASGVVSNLRTAVAPGPLTGERFVLFQAIESAQGADFNLDGDLSDIVLALYDGENDSFHNTALAVPSILPRVVESGSRLAFLVSEFGQSATDLDGDGDALDNVVFAWNADTGVALSSGLPAHPLIPFGLSGNVLHVPVEELQLGADLNGDGDTDDVVAHVVRL